MTNKTIKVSSFSLQPKARNRINFDPKIRKWLTPLLTASSYGYLPELAKFIEYFQENNTNLAQTIHINRYFTEALFRAYARTKENNDYISTSLEAITTGLYDNNREKILAALKNLQYEVNNQFGRDLQLGFEIEDYTGKIKRIVFNNVYSNFKRLELFILFIKEHYNISNQQINFIISSFHKNGYPSYHAAFLSELQKNVSNPTKTQLITKTQRLRLILDKNNRLAALNSCKYYLHSNLFNGHAREKIIGALSVYCKLSNVATKKVNLPEVTRIPGLYQQEDACVTINYKATRPEGYLTIPTDLPVKSKTPVNLITRYSNQLTTNWKKFLRNVLYLIFTSGLAVVSAAYLGLTLKSIVAIGCSIAGWNIASILRKIYKEKLSETVLYPALAPYSTKVEIVEISAKEKSQDYKKEGLQPAANIREAIANLEKAANSVQEKIYASKPTNIIKLPII